ncbi:MAG TPA: hypothetical protein PKW75_10155 [candidate division Zixibacteria bacterium]|nr:hypothetical protein [candidate division Zixibacteria bacterium]MDD4918384.1 hypothetical protein [candidate division Zixibacteria bacterium]MDM7973280.1 hypothetical protein [candidate division Zixibacteria bacterium]HOD66037.1 hypothetical protein [candidate division Zixibacteria bacterium]HOZ08636.1 hypothetical protein [candidate division Zixibacteria bacterium]
MGVRAGVAAALAALVIGCSSGDKQAGTAGGPSGMADRIARVDPAQFDLTGRPVALAGMTFQPPAAWVDLGPSGMRQASYYLRPVSGDADSATVTVFYFGPGGGGSVAANIDRWIGQMATGEKDNPSERAERSSLQADSLPVHVISVGGTYSGAMGGPMGGGGEAHADYRMVAAVIEAPEGNVFFKLTGPEKTAVEMQSGFFAMLKSVKRAG